MTTLDDLYVYYSRQHGCLPNSGFRNQLREMYEKADNTRNITELSLGKNYLGPKGLLPVFDLIRNVHSLQSIDLSGNGLDNDGCIALVESCIRHPSIIKIDLSRNSLHDGCASLLIRLLKENNRIQNLLLTGNNFSSTSREKISQLLDENRETPSVASTSHAGLVPPRATPYRATIDDFVSSAQSGGSLSYEYSWRKNPQYRLAVTRAAKTRITLNIPEPVATRLVGFTILKTKDARKALITDRPQHQHFIQQFKHDQALAPARYIGETTYSDTSCTLELDLDTSSTPCDSYIIIPHTFQPGKAFAFKLTAEVAPTIDCPTVTLEKVSEETDSWLLDEIEGGWTELSAGGPIDNSIVNNPAWRLNDMIRVRLDTTKSKSEPERHQSAATFFILLSIQNEETTTAAADGGAGHVVASSKNSAIEYQIGMDVLRPETSECVDVPRRPLRGCNKLFSYPHRNATTIAFAFDTRCNADDADFFLVPSLQSPGLVKSYRVAIFSSVRIRTSISAKGSEWSWKQLPQGQWDTETCGGCRADNPTTWINNPCYRVLVPDPYPVDMLLVLTSPGPAGGGMFRCESKTAMKTIDVCLEIDEISSSSSSDNNNNNNNHSNSIGCNTLHYASGNSTCTLWVNNLAPGEYWIIPQTRVAGTFAPYRLNMMTSSQVLVLSSSSKNDHDYEEEEESPRERSLSTNTNQPYTLSYLLRQQQLQRYDETNAARRAASKQASFSSATLAAELNNGASAVSQMTNDQSSSSSSAVVTRMRENAIKLYGTTGEMFTDRAFPRGTSSLWLNASYKPIVLAGTRDIPNNSGDIPDFPEEVFDWGRLTEMVTAPVFSPLQTNLGGAANPNNRMAVHVQGVDDSWFFSAVCSVVTKKSLANSIIVHADFAVGIFQFRFFKHGKVHNICVDDYIPIDGAGALCFAKSLYDQDDIFFPIIEKAWAKLHRCYEALDAFSTTANRGVVDSAASNSNNNSKSGYANSSLISQALADLTGGIPVERPLYDQAGQEWANRSAAAATTSSITADRYSVSLWSLLLDAHLEDVVVGVRICSKYQPRALEKSSYAGLKMDRLYPVLEAIEAEGVKLICLLSPWGWDGEEEKEGWKKGKWALNNNNNNKNWTEARKTAFDTASRPPNSFWVSLEELLYYFGVVHYVDLKSPIARIDCPIHFGGPPESKEWIHNTQYSLNLIGESDKKFATVILGLHDEDRRVKINRESNSKVDYSSRSRVPLRICALQVAQNERRITNILSASECTILSSSPGSARDMYYTIQVPLGENSNTNNKFIIMPCYDIGIPQDYTPAPPKLNCTLSAFVPGCGEGPSKLTPLLKVIQDDRNVSIEGEWCAGGGNNNYNNNNTRPFSAGGPPLTSPEWRSNPQYLLYPSEDMTVSIVLRQRNTLGSTVDHIGFCVIDTLLSSGSNSNGGGGVAGASRLMYYTPSTVIANAPHENCDAVSVSVKLDSISGPKRKGIPYVIVPSTSKPGAETGFTLTVVGNKPMQLKSSSATASAELDWKIVRIPDQKISVADGTAGGSTKFSSWRNNPQYCCKFPVGKSGRLIVTMIKKGASSVHSGESIGLVCFNGEDFQGGKRKRLSYRAEDVAGLGTSSSGLSAEIDFSFDNCTNSLLVMPFSELPFTEVSFDLVFYCTVDINVEKAVEWNQYQQESNWVAGSTAGGPRSAHGWINNPFFGITVSQPTRIYLLAMQYPHGPEKLMARKVGRQRVYIPPPIVNDHLAVEFALDLVSTSDPANLPVIACSNPTRVAETSVSAVLETPNNHQQYLAVPHTNAAGIEADFKLILYSDKPVEFTMLPPADPYRGRSF